MNEETKSSDTAPPPPRRSSFGCLHVLGILIVVLLVVLIGCVFWVKRNVYASSFKPTELRPKEQTVLENKLARLDSAKRSAGKTGNVEGGLEPEAYSEKNADREIRITERELNGLIAKDPEAAKHVAVDLGKDTISLKVVMPVDKEIPLVGGKTLRLSVGMRMRFEGERPEIALEGISLGGIPLPSAWMGDIKNKNLVKEFGDAGGFWNLFASGVEDLKIDEGELWIKLKE